MTETVPLKLVLSTTRERYGWDYQREMCKLIAGLEVGMDSHLAYQLVYDEIVRLKTKCGELPENYVPWATETPPPSTT